MEKSGLMLPKSTPVEPQNRRGKSWKVSRDFKKWNYPAKCWRENVSFCTKKEKNRSLGNFLRVNKSPEGLGAVWELQFHQVSITLLINDLRRHPLRTYSSSG